MANYLLSAIGSFLGTDEIFVHTLAVQWPTAGDEVNVANAGVQSFEDAFVTAGVAANFASQVQWDEFAAAEILDPSLGTLSAAFHASGWTAQPGGSGIGGAYQLAVAVSLIGGTRPNGTPLRGRFYLPAPAEGSVADGKLMDAAVIKYAGLGTAWFAELNTRGAVPSVWSRTLGVVQALTAANVGNTPDTIRSRRNALPEVRTAITV